MAKRKEGLWPLSTVTDWGTDPSASIVRHFALMRLGEGTPRARLRSSNDLPVTLTDPC